MELIKLVVIIIGGIIGAIGLFIGLYQYNKQQKFKRLQNLSFIWRKFIDSEDLLNLFDLMNSNQTNEIGKKDYTKVKLKFLALLEEVALYTSEFEVDKDHAIYLFQWHFYFVFNEKEEFRKSFWENIDELKDVDNGSYWKKSKEFASNCKPVK